jgi:cytoskeletal protein CcmA (bactofilin family)
MSLFNKKSDDSSTTASTSAPSAPQPKPSKPDPKNAGADTAMSVIAQGMRIVGDIECSGVLKIEGIVEGTIRGPRQLLLGRQGEVKGDMHAREVVLGGRVEGTVIADERIEIQGTALVTGDVHTKSIVVLEGGRINGAVRMDDGVSAAAATLGGMHNGQRRPDARPALAAS